MALVTIDTTTVAECDRLDFWRSTVCDQFVALDVRPAGRGLVAGRVTAATVADTHVRRISSVPHRFVRTERQVRAADEDYLQIALARRGRTLVVQDGRETVIGPGEFVIYDSSRPFSFVTSDSFEYSVCLHPKSRLPLSAAEMSAATAVTFDGRRGVGAMLPPLLSSLDRAVADDLPVAGQDAVARTIGDLFVALVRSHVPAAAPENLHVARARGHIRGNLADRDLCPASVAAACAISVSYLHKLFAEEDTSVVGVIREERLQGAWEDLRRRELAHLGVGAVGARWGMPDPAAFSRAFRARFGRSPSAHRAGST
ncbi:MULTISPECIES: helix-turn-helix domain-containing protein [unclassified Pseudonocardia]|uniref:AraC-like ligand-binding domain-containing protein n=1 Tax=unclassified Pseudonocardia TaxID=2619320 RepID=UPI0001FFE211|nr:MULTISPECIES: helix-turn-helix domain-containing protein [unclassified Pseudonocardia]ALE75099.1 AraC family transcriptional regulator [Pseudonocardia sp. EC080625-04]ALL74457.1 AraC family transcriptional regulator [Pseudonocardia sp. EC080610-09]ALL81477.1 AraC family transcriptional regulator [Pseudonocardia sp. EC080619-01]OLM16321.1 Transcriptional regulator, AraC family [Pseudonocardia sp. Ae707_Ps1]